MVRITSGAVPRLRLMSVRSNRGRRFRTLVAFALSFLLVASGFYGANSLADQHEERQTWNGNLTKMEPWKCRSIKAMRYLRRPFR